MNMELVMAVPIEQSIPNDIAFNYTELKAELSKNLEKYNSIVVTEDNIKEAKADKANLNNLSKALSKERISREKQYMKPFNVFKEQVKELESMVKKPIEAINAQIKALEEKELEKKKSDIEFFYKTNIKELSDVLPFEDVLPEKWENKGSKLIDITENIVATINKVRNDLQVIEGMKLDCEAQVKVAYLKILDMSEALAEKNKFEEQQKQLAEVKRQQEKARAVKSQPGKATFEPSVIDGNTNLSNLSPDNNVAFAGYADSEEKVGSVVAGTNAYVGTKTIRVIFYDTTSDFRTEMRALTEKHGIRYGGIK